MFGTMRKFHNDIKRKLYNDYTKPGDALLDLACGKGGDLNKWVQCKLSKVSGYDIDTESINESHKRYNIYKNKLQFNSGVLDLSKNVISGNKDYNVISSMFAFHYFFENQDTFEIIMTTIKNNLKIGGYFIGTIFDGDTINELLPEPSSIYTLKTNETIDFQLSRLSNHSISVHLRETVLDKPMVEYIVPVNHFKELMEKNGFELIETTMFGDYPSKYTLNYNETNISYLNRTFVFQRIQ